MSVPWQAVPCPITITTCFNDSDMMMNDGDE